MVSETRPLVSLVIPAYNAENTLQRLLDCVLGQSWKELQVILVDDGSGDRTGEIGKAAEKDPRLTVIRQGNKGISAARNAGLALCRGKYVRFVDADDTMAPDSVEKMVVRAERDGSELVIGGYDQYIGKTHSYHNLGGRGDTVACDEILDHVCYHANSIFYGVLWNKLFLRETVEKTGARFQENLTWGEDFAFVMDVMAQVRRISFMQESLYNYHRSAGSTTVRQVFDCFRNPLGNLRIKIDMYRHLQNMYRARGQYERYKNRLWLYLFRVGLG